MVGAYRAEHTKDWSAINGITPKFPPSYNGTTSSFKYEELIEVWLGVTVLDASKQRPALKNRLHGNAEKYKPLLSRDALKAEDGAKYFRDKLRPHFVKGAHSIFLWRFCLFILARRGNTEMVDCIGRFDLLLRRVNDSWKDGHVTFVFHDGTAKGSTIPSRHDPIK